MKKVLTLVLFLISSLFLNSISSISIEAKQNKNEYTPKYET